MTFEEFQKNLEPKLNLLIEQGHFDKATLILEGVLDGNDGLPYDLALGCIGSLVLCSTLQTVTVAKKVKGYASKYSLSPEVLDMVKTEVMKTITGES